MNTWKAEHRRKILFSLKEERIRRAQNEKSKEYFSAEHVGLEPVRHYNCPIPKSCFQANSIKNGTNGTL